MADSAPVGAGAAPLPSPPAPDGTLLIRGGVGGMSFQLEELLRGASQLDELVQQLLGLEEEALRIQDALEPFLYDSYDSGCRAVDAVAESRKEVGRVRQELAGVGASVRASHRDYVETEAYNARPHALRLDQIRSSGIPGFLALGRDLTEEGYNRLIPDGYKAADFIRLLLDSPLLTQHQPRPVSIEKMEEATEDVQPTMAESLRRLERLHALNDGAIEVIQFDNNGSPSWMVLIPGTQPQSPSTNPFDIQGIGEALGYDSEEVVPAVGQALREAGAAAGDPVVAVGHSQGGVHAMNLSQNKAFLNEFDLKYVLTAGAPVGDITPEPGIASLHLEHVQDWVPGTDGRMNADTKERVTVTLTDELQAPDGEDPGLGPGHDQENYAAGAELVAASHDESLLASSAAFAGVVGAGGTAKVTRFKLQRAPMPDQSSALQPASPPTVRETKADAGSR
ncbi:hypothetical protein [Paenarthrobacter nitroguajacolicus]|nr:hypothetical protein [Paenarthrobacter nitroguajacolicus]